LVGARLQIFIVGNGLSGMYTNEENFTKLLFKLEPHGDDDDARYKQLRFKLIKFFAWRRCEDPEGLADETISRTAKRLNEGEEILAENPYAYLYAVGKNVYREYWRGKKKDEAIVKGLPESESPLIEGAEDCRSYCLQKISANKQRLLREYYLGERSRETLAQSLDLTINGLRLKVHRLKNDLKSCYKDCIKKLLNN
jgi:DNA-directed RNA polymerase specialized sigma24 family protein